MSESDSTGIDFMTGLLSRRALLRRAAIGAGALTAAPALARAAMAAAAPQKGGTLRMARVADIVTFDPILMSDNLSLWGAYDTVYRGFLRVNPTGTGFVPELAQSWKVAPDARTYTFHLRPGLRFSDGSPVKASDAVFSLKRINDPKSISAGTFAPGMTLSTPDDHTIVCHFKSPSPAAIAQVAIAPIYSEAWFKQAGPAGFGRGPVGTGPWTLQSWQKGVRVTLKANPHYWNASRPYLDSVQLLVMPEDNTRVLRLEAGEIDIATEPPFNQLAALSKKGGIKVQTWPLFGANLIWLNHKRPQFQDRNVRQAMNYAIDKNAIIKSVLFGHAKPETSILPPMKLASANKPYPYDPEKAKALLKKSKQPNGFSTTLMIPSGDTVSQAIATIMQAQLGAIGIKMAINPIELNTLNGLVAKYQYDMFIELYTSDPVDPDSIFEFAAVGHQFVDSFFTHYYNPQVNKLWTQSGHEPNPAKRQKLYNEMQRIVWNDAPDIFLYYPDSRAAMRQNVHGFEINPTAHYFLENVWKD